MQINTKKWNFFLKEARYCRKGGRVTGSIGDIPFNYCLHLVILLCLLFSHPFFTLFQTLLPVLHNLRGTSIIIEAWSAVSLVQLRPNLLQFLFQNQNFLLVLKQKQDKKSTKRKRSKKANISQEAKGKIKPRRKQVKQLTTNDKKIKKTSPK